MKNRRIEPKKLILFFTINWNFNDIQHFMMMIDIEKGRSNFQEIRIIFFFCERVREIFLLNGIFFPTPSIVQQVHINSIHSMIN